MKKAIILIIVFLQAISYIYSNISNSIPFIIRHITVNAGLPSNKINQIAEDKMGYIWFATENGLCRYDGYDIKIYKHNNSDTSTIRGNSIPSILSDSQGRLWVGVEGLQLYNPEKDNFARIEPQLVYDFGDIYDIFEDNKGILWLGTNKRGLFKYLPEEKIFEDFMPENYNCQCLSSSNVNILTQDHNGNLWIGTEDCGLIIYNIKKNVVINDNYLNDPYYPKAGIRIRELFTDISGDIWIGTFDSGLFRYIKDENKFKHYIIDPFSKATQRVRAIHRDILGNLWLGTRGGLFLYQNDKFIRYAHENHPFSILSQNSIFNIFEDSKGGLWIGTYSGGVNYINLYQKAFRSYNAKVNDNNYLNNQNVYCMASDDKNIWIGTENGGLNHLDKNTGKYEYFMNQPGNKNSIISNNIKEILIDENSNLWIGSYNGGLSYFNTKTRRFINYNNKKTSEIILPSDDVYSLLIDSEKYLWVGTRKGLVRINPKTKKNNKIFYQNKFISNEITNLYEDASGLIWIVAQTRIYTYDLHNDSVCDMSYINNSNQRIYTILTDKYNNIWTGGNAGLFLYKKAEDTLIIMNENISEDFGNVYGILESRGDLWISTNQGMYKLENVIDSLDNFQSKRFSIYDGLINVMYNYNSYFKSNDGEMFFGGVSGMNSFYPEDISENNIKPDVVLTNLMLFNQLLKPGQEINKRVILKNTLNTTDEIELLYNENIFTIEFSGLHYAQPAQNKYKYRLKGFKDEWTYTDGERRIASYTNLAPGYYTFEVFASNSDGLWNDQPASINIKIKPAFWNTLWFKIISIAFVFTIIIILYYRRISRIKTLNIQLEKKVKERTLEIEEKNVMLEKQTHELEDKNNILEANKIKIEAQTIDLENSNLRLKELNSTKDKFFSIIAHDIKNPFVGIMGFCNMLKNNVTELSQDELKMLIDTLNESTANLYALLENLLFWARSQTNTLKYTPEKFSIKEVVNKNISLLHDNAKRKDINIIVEGEHDYSVKADLNMINTIIQNLLSNAIKFTPQNGKIKAVIKEKGDFVEIKIKDTGIGMDEEEKTSLFKIDKSFSKPGTDGEVGSGLGLILCKEFVEKNNGEIYVKSKVNHGTEFKFTLPLFH